MTPEERAQWFEHNTYWAPYMTYEYAWCYSERMNWWKDQTPPALETAIVSARQKIAEGKPLGFDIETLVAAARKLGNRHGRMKAFRQQRTKTCRVAAGATRALARPSADVT
jgi:hypothetical protein